MKVFAVADVVPEGCDYLTAGKEYEVVREKKDSVFVIKDNEGRELYSFFGFFGGCDWRRVEREE